MRTASCKKPAAGKLLFVCSRNRWRSPTAEALFDGSNRWQVRSAGTEPAARVRVTARMIGWADWIFCMEKRHVGRLRERFDPALFEGKRLVCLDIPDDYGFMDPELVDLLRAALGEYVELPATQREEPKRKKVRPGG